MKQIITAGSTSVRQTVFIANTAGTGVTGLTTGALTWYWYSNTNGTSSAITAVGETLGTWTSGGFVQIDATHLPGFYELGVPNALFASGVQWSVMGISGTAFLPVNVEFEVTVQNLQGTLTATVPSLTTNVNVQQWLGTAVTSQAGIPIVYPSGGTIGVVTGTVTATVPALTTNVNVVDWLGTAVTSDAGTPVVFTTNTVTATVPSLSTNVNVQQWAGHAVVTPNLNGVPVVDVTDWLGTAVTSNAGVPLVDVNAITGTVTATVIGGTISTVTGTVGSVTAPVSISTGQLTVKRDTALSGFTFPMYNGTTGNLQTGLTVACMLSIDGGTLQSSTNGVTEIGNGIYKLNLAAADLNGTVIILVFTATAASATVISLITQA